MKFKELKNKPKAELEKLLKESQDKLRDLKFKAANRSLKNVREIRNMRRLIAKFLTALKMQDTKVRENTRDTNVKK
ncbi:50S ribosomal protein L29 [Patescibacteria group bacterium]